MINIQKPCTATLVLSSKRKKRKRPNIAIPFNLFLVNFVMQPKWGSSKEGLAKFGYKINMKVKFLKHPSIFFGYLLEPCSEIWPKIKKKKKLVKFWLLKITKMNSILALLFIFLFWLYIARKKRVCPTDAQLLTVQGQVNNLLSKNCFLQAQVPQPVLSGI